MVSDILNYFKDNKEAIQLIIQGISVVIIPILLFYIGNNFQKRSKLEEGTLIHKKKIFDNFVHALYLLFEWIYDEQDSTKKQKYEAKMKSVRMELITVASLDTIKAFNEWASRGLGEKAVTDEETAIIFDRILYFLRRDLGIRDEAPYYSVLANVFRTLKKIIQFEYLHPINRYDRFQFLWVNKLNIPKQSRITNIFIYLPAIILTILLLPVIIPYALAKSLYKWISRKVSNQK